MKIFAVLAQLIAFCFSTSVAMPAQGMIRVMKYRPLTEVKEKEICIYAEHELNPKRENIGHPQNTKDPIVCRLVVSAEAESNLKAPNKTLSNSVVKRFEFGKLSKACVSYHKILPKDYTVKHFKSLTTECATLAAAKRVFPEFKAQAGKLY